MSRINVVNSSEDSIGAEDLSFEKDEEDENTKGSNNIPK